LYESYYGTSHVTKKYKVCNVFFVVFTKPSEMQGEYWDFKNGHVLLLVYCVWYCRADRRM